MRIALPLALLATALSCSLFAVPAQAQRDRVFVASYGSDSNPCTFGSPCKTFQIAFNAVAAGGEVTAIDSAGFGLLVINHAVTITSPDGVEAGIAVPTGGTAITINAGPTDAVFLRGLTLDGAGIGYNGVAFTAGGSLTVTNCVMQNFVENGTNTATGNGIYFAPGGTFNFAITNTIASNNGYAGINFLAQSSTGNGSGVINHVTATDNKYGISIDMGTAGGSLIYAAISNTVASANSVDGIYATSGVTNLNVAIDNAVVIGNPTGIAANGFTFVTLGRSVITGNTLGVKNTTSPNWLYTYQDNRIDLNGSDISTAGGVLLSKTLH